MSTDVAPIEQALIAGDLAKLSVEQRLAYYRQVCDSLGLNPLTQPFAYITLNGKLVLYAKRDCTEQLRKLHAVSVAITGREVVEGCYIVTARATQGERMDESIGAVPIDGLKGETRANAMMKAETKAKRRVTLSICGLGLLDETEVDSIPEAAREAPAPPPLPTRKSARDAVIEDAVMRIGAGPSIGGHVSPPPVATGRGEAEGSVAMAAASSAPTVDVEPLEEQLRASLIDPPISKPEARAFYGHMRRCLDAASVPQTEANLKALKTLVKTWLGREVGVEHIEDIPESKVKQARQAVPELVALAFPTPPEAA